MVCVHVFAVVVVTPLTQVYVMLPVPTGQELVHEVPFACVPQEVDGDGVVVVVVVVVPPEDDDVAVALIDNVLHKKLEPFHCRATFEPVHEGMAVLGTISVLVCTVPVDFSQYRKPS